MRLKVTYASSVPDDRTSWYTIQPLGEAPNKDVLEAIIRKIEPMAKHILGDNFIYLIATDTHIEMSIRQGTSKSKHFDLRALYGWIELSHVTP